MTSCIYILRFIFVNVYFLVNISILIKTNQSVEIYFSLNKKRKENKRKTKKTTYCTDLEWNPLAVFDKPH